MFMKKIMWMGFTLEIIMLIILLILVVLQLPVPALVTIIFGLGMLTCLVFSFFVIRENRDKEGKNNTISDMIDRKRYYFRIIFMLIPIIIMLIITHIFFK